jgi:hypothetical protein
MPGPSPTLAQWAEAVDVPLEEWRVHWNLSINDITISLAGGYSCDAIQDWLSKYLRRC